MSKDQNEYHLVAFDPGGAGIGWAHFIIHFRAFTRPEHRVLRHLKKWKSGQFEGDEFEQINEAVRLIHRARFGDPPFVSATDVLSRATAALDNRQRVMDVVSEGFELTQLLGGNDLLSPVRINAVLTWECRMNYALRLRIQNRQMRTSVTRRRLEIMGFKKRYRKDEFAAMQHAIVWLRRVKRDSMERPWKLSAGGVANRAWDCACAWGEKCDLRHS